MGKDLFIAEKPSVAREFAKALKYNMSNRDGYMESNEAIDVYKRQGLFQKKWMSVFLS